MPSAKQSAANHTAIDPVTHLILGPIFIATFLLTIVLAFHARGPMQIALHLWLIVLAFALVLLSVKQRIYSLKLQDRIIRLEERLRLAALLPPAEAAAAVRSLTVSQLIALRFASDAELPALVARTLTENLDPKQIKQSITHWRADLARV